MFYLFDKNETLIAIIPFDSVQSAYMTENINAADKLELQLQVMMHEDALYIGHLDLINSNKLRLYRIESATSTNNVIDVLGIEAAYDDLSVDGYVGDIRPTNQSILNVSNQILGEQLFSEGTVSASRWITGIVETVAVYTGSHYYESRLKAILDVCDATGAEVVFELSFNGREIYERKVNWYNRVGADRGIRFEHGSKLLNVIAEEKRGSIVTALVGRGKGKEVIDEETGESTGGYGRRINFAEVEWTTPEKPVNKPLGQLYVEIPEATAAYGYPDGRPRTAIKIYEDIDNVENLLTQTYNDLVELSRPHVQYKATIRDEGVTEIGDTVGIIRDDLGIRYKTRIFRLRTNLLNPKERTADLGDQVKSYLEKRLLQTSEKVDALEKNQQTAVNQMLEQMAKQYWGEDGYNYDLKAGNEYGLPAGVYSFDKPIDESPTSFVAITAGKLVISNDKDILGNWVIGTIADGDGLATGVVGADQIKAGSISADHIDAGGIRANQIILSNSENAQNAIASLESGEIRLTSYMEQGAINRLFNPTYGTKIMTEKAGWSTGFVMTLLLNRFRDKTMAQMLSTLSGKTINDLINYNY